MDKQYCPKCGNEVKAGAKFCPKCGTQLTAQTNVNNAANTAAAPANEFFGNFFKWFFETVKHPSANTEANNNYFGLVSFIVSAVISIITISVISSRIQDGVSSLPFVDGSDGVISEIISASAGKLDMMIVFMMAIYVVFGFLFKKFAVAGTGKKVDFWKFVNKLASYTNLSVILLLVIFLFTIISALSAVQLDFFLLLLIFGNTIIGFTYAILDGETSNSFDKLYILLLANICIPILDMIVITTVII